MGVYLYSAESNFEEERTMSGNNIWDQDRRKHQRFPANFPVRVKVWAGGESQAGTCLNLSQGGLLVEVAELLPRGTRVLVSLDLQKVGKFVCVQADVVWDLDFSPEAGTRPSMGLRFTGMDEEAETLLNQMIVNMARPAGSGAIPQPKR